MKETSNMKETVCLSTKTSDFFKGLTEMQFFTLSKAFFFLFLFLFLQDLVV